MHCTAVQSCALHCTAPNTTALHGAVLLMLERSWKLSILTKINLPQPTLFLPLAGQGRDYCPSANILYTVHCALPIYFTLYTVHCQYTLHCTLYTAQCTLHNVQYTLDAVHLMLYTGHCIQQTLQFTSAHCPLNTAHYTIH